MWSALFGGGGASTSRRNAPTHGQGGAAPRHEHGRGRHGGPNTPRTLSLGELERLHEQVVRTQSIGAWSGSIPRSSVSPCSSTRKSFPRT